MENEELEVKPAEQEVKDAFNCIKLQKYTQKCRIGIT